ncbi:MAG: Lrp/AsnC family transcriptional regulator [Haloquadratum sp.]|jgi:DNA-binding Lrp family transcriptional regulator|nr:Lrp/AsnC family transcriptional regulator [Haloferacaceae archaeon]MDR9445038.1 Lrp/AsnC family transcriptional regulator [Haloquadratum sp.]
MDIRDLTLLKTIADHRTGSPERLHELTDIPLSTIHYRLNNLRDAGVITSDLYDIDPEAAGFEVTILIEVLTDYSGSHHDFEQTLLAVPGVTQVYFTMGETDFIIIAQLPSVDEVEATITSVETIEGIRRTDSTFVISTLRSAHSPMAAYPLESLIASLAD